MIANADGLSLQPQIAPGFSVTLNFTPQPFPTNPNSLASFSSTGPNVDLSIKPEMVAVGQSVYTATQTADPFGDLYNPTGYIIASGTSFSAPLVAGAAAVLQQARPGLSVNQYRSLLIDSASPAWLNPTTPAGVQQAGAGLLNVLSALNVTAAASPATLGFGSGATSTPSSVSPSRMPARWPVAVPACRATERLAPSLSRSSVQSARGASVSVPVTFQASALAP